MTTLFSESFTKLAKFIFDFYDFDKDGLISKEDVKVVLSYIPLNTKKYSQSIKLKFEQEDYKDRVESQDELHNMVEKCFKNAETMDQSGFLSVVENVNSDIFLFILIFLLEKRPFSKQTLNEFQNVKSKNSNLLGVKTSTIESKVLIASPTLQSKFTPSITISKSPSMSKRNTLPIESSANLESRNLLGRLSGKPTAGETKSVLLKYTGKGGNNEHNDEGTDEGVSVNNVRGIPITRKQRHNLRDIEAKKETAKADYDNLPITPAIKLPKKTSENE